MNSGVDDSLIVAVIFLVALAFLAGAILLIKHTVRRKDVMHGGYVANDDED
jgi:hypothetical protein